MILYDSILYYIILYYIILYGWETHSPTVQFIFGKIRHVATEVEATSSKHLSCHVPKGLPSPSLEGRQPQLAF